MWISELPNECNRSKIITFDGYVLCIDELQTLISLVCVRMRSCVL